MTVLRLPDRDHLNGPEGLLAAVIAQAVKDVMDGERRHKVDATLYFLSDVYVRHLEMLGLAPDILPAPFEEHTRWHR